jgi:hypothetical protein
VNNAHAVENCDIRKDGPDWMVTVIDTVTQKLVMCYILVHIMYVYAYTHTHTHIYIYIYTSKLIAVFLRTGNIM